MNANRITTFCTEERDQRATNRMGLDEKMGRDEEAGHSQRSAYLSRWAIGTSGPCLPFFLPRTFELDMSDKDARPDKEDDDILKFEERCQGD